VKVTSPSLLDRTSLVNRVSPLSVFTVCFLVVFILGLRTSTNKMCLDDKDTYTTRAYVSNGARYSEEYTKPRHRRSWRRRNGFGGSYYPSRYYSRPPSGRYMSSALTQNRYSAYGPRPHRHSYPPRGYPQYNGYSRAVVPGGHAGYSSGYGRYYPDNRVAMPHHAAVVSPRSFLFLPIALPSCLLFCTPPSPLPLARVRYRSLPAPLAPSPRQFHRVCLAE
jgi:hypothetical protein